MSRTPESVPRKSRAKAWSIPITGRGGKNFVFWLRKVKVGLPLIKSRNPASSMALATSPIAMPANSCAKPVNNPGLASSSGL
jgi:hypothetical protein